jgi:hypothetical protein
VVALGLHHRLAAAHLGEVLDRHHLAVDLQVEVVGLEVGYPLALLVGGHHLDVDHPHLDLLAEEALGVAGRRRLAGLGGRQAGQRDPQKPGDRRVAQSFPRAHC